MVLSDIFSRYYTFVFVMVILLYTITFNSAVYRKVKSSFAAIVILTVLESVCSTTETVYAGGSEASIFRTLLSTACYILRPAIMYTMLLIVVRNDSRKLKLIYGIPLLAASLILIADIPGKLVFSYSPDNLFETGILFPITYLILFIYLALLLILTYLRRDAETGISEMLTIYIGIGFIILNIIGERENLLRGNADNATILAILIYAIHFKYIEDQRERRLLETREQKTGLLNENACIAWLGEMLTRSVMEEYATVYFDLERFGLINDKYGAETGNRILAEYAGIMAGIVRQDEVLARQGGDRFIAVILRRNLDVFLAQLGSTRVKFSEGGNDYDIAISAHAGVYLIDRDAANGEEIISNALMALNHAKKTGNSVAYMTAELKAMLRDEKQFASDIPIAMAAEEFIPYYQPKVNSRTSTLCGAEALVRWLRNGELIPPAKFIPILETKDLMCDMDFYMLRHVCADIAGWIERGLVPPTVSVNFSRRNLSNRHLAADIDAIVQKYHVPKKLIEIEITETIDEFPISVLGSFVDDLHRLGYKVAVDDFGSGSSSLSLLREVAFDTLKIDKGFVDRAYARDLAILSHMIKLSNDIGAETLAEGVEQREQVDTLMSMGCEIIQGFYYDRPLPRTDFEDRIVRRRYDDQDRQS